VTSAHPSARVAQTRSPEAVAIKPPAPVALGTVRCARVARASPLRRRRTPSGTARLASPRSHRRKEGAIAQLAERLRSDGGTAIRHDRASPLRRSARLAGSYGFEASSDRMRVAWARSGSAVEVLVLRYRSRSDLAIRRSPARARVRPRANSEGRWLRSASSAFV
jgi:hypothetical protein